MKHESDFRHAIVLAIKGQNLMAQPIESGSTALGIPDLYIRTSKKSIWMELKNFRYPIQCPFEVPFRPGQKSWLERHYRLGGLSILGIATPLKKYFFVNDKIKNGYSTDDMQKAYSCEYVIGEDFVAWLDSL